MKKIRNLILCTVLLCAQSILSAASFFSGYAGGKLNLGSASESEDYSSSMKLQAFFQGQFNISRNIWGHLEFSLDTDNLFSESLFYKTNALFQLDELSLTSRQTLETITNYFSIYMGNYDSIGSDIFLRRQFGISPVGSKLSESWLGTAGSLLYPHFGMGIADVIKFPEPLCAGAYLYFNNEDADCYVFNADARAAGVFRFFTFDVAGGIGVPLSTTKYSDVFVTVDKIYWHAGTTLLFGNNYTSAFFLQTGVYNAAFQANDEGMIFGSNGLYLLMEPRINGKKIKMHITFYSLPQKAVDELLFIHDTLGLNINIFSDNLSSESNSFNLGLHTSISFPGKSIMDMRDMGAYMGKNTNIFVTPYITANLFGGELNSMLSLNLMPIFKGENLLKAMEINIGYKTSF